MNAMGEIGNFIIKYQDPLQVAAIAILVVGGVVCVGKAIASACKRQRMLTQISETVAEINTNVKNLNEKRTEVIYIDGRPLQELPTVPRPVEVKKTTIVAEEPVAKEKGMNNKSEADTPPTVKYFSRDCAVAKDGRQYTLEELNAQIRD